jgi:hypothetical protein
MEIGRNCPLVLSTRFSRGGSDDKHPATRACTAAPRPLGLAPRLSDCGRLSFGHRRSAYLQLSDWPTTGSDLLTVAATVRALPFGVGD